VVRRIAGAVFEGCEEPRAKLGVWDDRQRSTIGSDRTVVFRRELSSITFLFASCRSQGCVCVCVRLVLVLLCVLLCVGRDGGRSRYTASR
jgi:hypothetical protein